MHAHDTVTQYSILTLSLTYPLYTLHNDMAKIGSKWLDSLCKMYRSLSHSEKLEEVSFNRASEECVVTDEPGSLSSIYDLTVLAPLSLLNVYNRRIQSFVSGEDKNMSEDCQDSVQDFRCFGSYSIRLGYKLWLEFQEFILDGFNWVISFHEIAISNVVKLSSHAAL